MDVKMIKVKEIDGFNPKAFCIKPSECGYYFLRSYEAPDAMAMARELAKDIDDICIAIVCGGKRDYALGEYCCNGLSSKFFLFNAAEADYRDADMKVVTYDRRETPKSTFLYSKWIRFEKGAVL